MTDEPDLVRFTLCSMHQEKQEDCLPCSIERVMPREEYEADQELFRTDYVEWYWQKNRAKPNDSAWKIWEQLTGETRPNDAD